MKKMGLILAAFIILCMQNVGIAQTSQKWLTTYHPTWWYGVYKPSMIDFSSMTHIAIFAGQDALSTAPYFNSAGIDDGTDYPQIVTMAHAKGVKVLISAVGGYGQSNMPVVAADPVKCQAFVDAACAYAKAKNADGIELDWEFPYGSDDIGWNRLIRLFRQKLDTWSPRGVLATSMFYGTTGPNVAPYHVDSMMVFDQINLMSYTMWMGTSSGPFKSGYDTPINAPTNFSGYNGWGLNTPAGPLSYITAGYPASKLGLGISFEGTRFDGVTTLGQAYSGWGFTSSVTHTLSTSYAAIPATGRVWDPVAQANYCVSGNSVYSFQDTNSVKAIANWAKAQNFGGVMIYDLATGYDNGAAVPDALLKVVGNVTIGSAYTAPVAVPTGTLVVSSSTVPAGGGSVTLTWTSTNATSASIDQGVGTVALNGSTTVAVTANKTYTLTLTGAGGTQQYAVKVTVNSIPPTGTFTGSIASLPIGGGNVTLTWTSANAASASIDQSVGTVALNGSTTVSVTATKTFTLTLTNATGTTATYTVPVTVAAAPALAGVYSDTYLASPWTEAGSNAVTLDFANTEKVLTGTTSLKLVGTAWANPMFRHGTWAGTTPVDASQFDSLHFAIHGGTAGVAFTVNLADDNASMIGTKVSFTVPANVWTIKSIPMSALNPSLASFTVISMQLNQTTTATFYIDDFRFIPKAAAVVPSVPSAPTFVYPVPASVNNPTSVSMTWTKIAGATTYHVQMSTDSTFKTFSVNDSTLTDTVRAITGLANSTKYFRRIRAKNTAGWGAFCSLCQFSTIVAAPVAPVLASPASGAVNQPTSVVLTWNASANAATYRVQLATDSLFTSLVANDSTLTTVTKSIGSLVNGTKYYWRVNAKNVAGTSAYSTFAAFTTIVVAPAAPVLASPVNGATNQALSLALSWTASAGAATYRVQCSADSLFTTFIANDSTVKSTSYTVKSLANLTQYFWRVNAKNANGTSAFSATQRFTTLPYVKLAKYFTPVTGTGSNATVAIPATASFFIGGATLVNGDEIGAFTPAGLCVGSVEWNGANTALTVWGDNSQTTAVDGMRSGETIQYRVYRQAVNTVYSTLTAQYSTGLGMYQVDGLSTIASLTTATTPVQTLTQTISLSAGWNMISTNVKPNKTAIDSLTAQLGTSMTIIKNGAGLIYWPSMSINTLGFYNYTNGYLVYMAKAATLSCTGEAITPEATPIALSQGWNLAPYVRASAMNVTTALAGLGSSISVVKNSAGQVYWPAYGINTIGSLATGQAYQMYLTQSSTLVYPSNSLAKSGDEPMASVQNITTHYPALSQRGGLNEIVLVKDAGFQNGDEIAVRTSKNILAGTGVVSNGAALVTVWADDAYTTDVIEGAVEGEVLSIARWSVSDGKEHNVSVTSLTDGLTGAPLTNGFVFTPNGVAVAVTAVAEVKTMPTDYSLLQNYPNPFNPSTVIKYALPTDGMVTLKVYNSLGAEVATLVSGTQTSGMHEVSFNASGLSSGIYFYTLKTGAFTKTQRMMLLK